METDLPARDDRTARPTYLSEKCFSTRQDESLHHRFEPYRHKINPMLEEVPDAGDSAWSGLTGIIDARIQGVEGLKMGEFN